MPILFYPLIPVLVYLGYQEFQKYKAQKEAAKEPVGDPVNPAEFGK